MMKTVTLYRPVGQKELDLIRESGFAAFPPRLAHQPIFYPVLNEEYATQIARDWNTRDAASGYAGYVTRFEVRADYLDAYPVQTVGSQVHREYWIPAEDLAQFNDCIVGHIQVIAEFFPAPPRSAETSSLALESDEVEACKEWQRIIEEDQDEQRLAAAFIAGIWAEKDAAARRTDSR